MRKVVCELGEEFNTSSSGKCVVISYKDSANVTVRFIEHESVVISDIWTLKLGLVKNPNKPSIFGKGFIGIGEYTSRGCGRIYRTWYDMLKRCYCKKYQVRASTYKDVEVCEEWHNFQNFAEWCYSQRTYHLKDIKGRVYQLDKDVLIKGNKIYSPYTCCFIPQEINGLFSKPNKTNKNYPSGIFYHKDRDRFTTKVICRGKVTNLGYFKTAKEAFFSYKKAKELCIKQVAEFWKHQIDSNVYSALINYEVHIDD